MTELKKTAATSLIWNSINKVGFQMVALIVGIITARLLSREDFGYIAALALFTVLSNILVESGFTAALIRRNNNTQADYSGAFFFNLLLSIVLYLMLFFAAPTIANYFNIPELRTLARVLFFAIIINAFGIIPTIILTKNFQFKHLTIANLLGVSLSAFITIYLAMNGYGYWAIAAQQLTQVGSRVIFTCLFCRWTPSTKANFSIIKELLSFSSALILTSIMSNCVKYVYNFIIGVRYSAAQLGCYGQAYKFQNIATTVISSTLTGVSYPIISKLNNEKERQIIYLRKMMRICAFFTFPVMVGMYAVAPNFISVVLTDKWMPMLPYFKILLLSALVLPFINISLNTIIALGHTKVNLYIELARNAIIIALLLVMNDTIETMLWGFLIANFIGYIISITILGKHIKYTFIEHVKDIMPYAILSFIMLIAIVVFTQASSFNIYTTFAMQILIGATLYFGMAILFGSQIIKDVKQIIFKH